MKRFPPFSAVVLAGGHSSRMGRDKALLPLADARTLLARQLAILLSAGASELLVSARAEQKLPLEGARLVLDTHSGQGPLAGIAAALATAVHPQVLVLAIDLGQMPAEFLAGLVAASRPGHGLIPLRSGEPEPLAAVYPGNFGPFAVQALAAGERRASDWARQLVNQGLSEWRDVTPMEAGYFANWNTPADLGPKLGPTA